LGAGADGKTYSGLSLLGYRVSTAQVCGTSMAV
jgi:hypothetical protein